MQENGLIKKGKVNFKIYDIAIWELGNCNAPIAELLKK